MKRRKKSVRSRPRMWLAVFTAGLFFVVGLSVACRRAVRTTTPGGAHQKAVPPAHSVDVRDPHEPAAEPSQDSQPSTPILHLTPCLLGCPVSARGEGGRLLEREGWVLFNNPRTKFADWVAYRLSPSTIGKSKSRDWKADPDLPAEETLEPDDFRGARAKLHTDRGHQVPLASFSGTRNYEPLNYMSNVTPQHSVLNQKLWNLLEQAERTFVLEEHSPLFVVTGPLYEHEMAPLPGADEAHTVPSGYFKVIALQTGELIETAALIAEQETAPRESYCDHEVTIDEVERRAGLDLFPLLPDGLEREMERNVGALFERMGCRLER